MQSKINDKYISLVKFDTEGPGLCMSLNSWFFPPLLINFSLFWQPAGFFVCGLNLTLPEDVRILKYIIRLCDNFPNVINRSLPRMLQWVVEQACKTPMNIVASDIATRDYFVYTVVQLNISKCNAHKGT